MECEENEKNYDDVFNYITLGFNTLMKLLSIELITGQNRAKN